MTLQHTNVSKRVFVFDTIVIIELADVRPSQKKVWIHFVSNLYAF